MARVATLKTRNLTAKQEAFVREYLVDRNATQAAIRAGYSARNAMTIARDLLHKKPVCERIERAETEHFRTLNIRVERVLERHLQIVESDPRDYMSWDGSTYTLKPSDSLSRAEAVLIQEVSIDAHGNVKLKLCDKQKSLEALGKYLGIEKTNIDAKITADVDQSVALDLSRMDPMEIDRIIRTSAELERR